MIKQLLKKIKPLVPFLQASAALITCCNGMLQLNQHLDITNRTWQLVERRLHPPAIEQREPKTQVKGTQSFSLSLPLPLMRQEAHKNTQ
jgi:hypothetical protein